MSNYHSIDGMSYALEKQKARARRSKRIVIATIAGVLVLIAVGVTAGILVSKNNSKSSTTTGTKSNSKDPSNFTKDPRLHKSFYGLAYTPEGSLMPNCGNSLDHVIKDIQIISQLTSRIRLYGADCNQTALVLEAIKQTKVDVEVFLGNYVVATEPTAYERQRNTIKDAILTYGTDHIAGITVGNEFMLNYVTLKQSLDPNGPAGIEGAAILKGDIDDTRNMLTSLNLKKNIPVGNSDAGSFFNKDILASIDYGMSNVHAWFANTTAEGASAWVNEFFQESNLKPAAALPNQPKMYIAETGWPSASSDVANANNGGSDASIAGLQTFLDTFVCEANQNGIGYFYFEYRDEEWKDIQYGGVEGHWGLFNKDGTFKDITIPNCPAP
ncbi:glycoside hydrolase family 17 protein [Crucibulum laeve]|uniref:glucan endo-1,3-beta-D-glucosidase n=1 Tax=Crucibulum laeve TaxID=68775 RepID=A0A5C3MG73_9AGAR|nr:glycoside hydrolase family 17 protein [Crucibulum laeve]